jgi:hypothetical protein
MARVSHQTLRVTVCVRPACGGVHTPLAHSGLETAIMIRRRRGGSPALWKGARELGSLPTAGPPPPHTPTRSLRPIAIRHP